MSEEPRRLNPEAELEFLRGVRAILVTTGPGPLSPIEGNDNPWQAEGYTGVRFSVKPKNQSAGLLPTIFEAFWHKTETEGSSVVTERIIVRSLALTKEGERITVSRDRQTGSPNPFSEPGFELAEEIVRQIKQEIQREVEREVEEIRRAFLPFLN